MRLYHACLPSILALSLLGCGEKSGSDTDATTDATTDTTTGTATDSPTGTATDSPTGTVTGTTTATDPGTESDTATGTESDTATGTESDTDGEPAPLPEACECIPDDVGSGTDVPSPITCGDDICPVIDVDDDANTNSVVTNPDALACAFDALTAKTPGVIRWDYKFNSSQYEELGYLVIRDDGTLLRRNWGQMDLDFIVDDALLIEAPSDETLAECTAMDDLYQRFECMRNFPRVEIAVCDEGWAELGGASVLQIGLAAPTR